MSDIDNKILNKINERIEKFESDLKDRQYPDTKQKLKGGLDELQQLKKWIVANGLTTTTEPALNIDLVSKRFFEVHYMDEEMIKELKVKFLAEDSNDAERQFYNKYPNITWYMILDLDVC